MQWMLIILGLSLSPLFAQEHVPARVGDREKQAVTEVKSGTINRAAPLTRDDVLSIKDGRFFLDGKPFAEISFNKFDLLWQLYD